MRRTVVAAVAALVLAAPVACTTSAGSPGSPTAGSTRTPSPPSTATTTTTSRQVTTPASSTRVPQLSVGPAHQLPVGAAPGLSGLAPGPVTGHFFAVDDKTGTTELLVIEADGTLVGRVEIAGMRAVNAEALSTATCGTGRCLYVGDIGDNTGGRDDIVVYRVTVPLDREKATRWRYTYPDGPHNAEAMVIAAGEIPIIITKPDRGSDGTVAQHRIYRGRPGGGKLELVGTFDPPKPTVPLQSLLVGNVVTDAAYADGRLLLVTYDQVIEYRAPSSATDPATFPRWPRRSLPFPTMIQTEAVAIVGCGYLVGSEAGPGGTRSAVTQVNCN